MRALLATLFLCGLCLARADMYADDSGTVRKVQRVFVDDAGTVREIKRIYVDDGGTVRLVFQNAVVTVTGGSITPGLAITGVRFNSTGTVQRNADGSLTQINSGTDWVIPNSMAPGTYSVRATLLSGDSPSGSALGSWLALSSSREWDLNSGGVGVLACDLRIEISDDGGSTVLESGDYHLETAT